MPELPEVETVRRGLLSFTGAQIESVQVLHPRAIRTLDATGSVADILPGATLSAPFRRGKFLWFELDHQYSQTPVALVIHLGMSGQLLVDQGHQHKHKRIAVHTLADHALRVLNFIDQRTFGFFALSECGAQIPQALSHIARDIFDPAFSLDELIVKLAQRKAPIKNILLQQSLISGVGNIYADESLWLAGIHPLSVSRHIPEKKLQILAEQLYRIMECAIAQGGTSFDALYVSVNGESGKFSHSLQVYGHAGQPCQLCGAVLEKIMINQRSATFCGHCQQLY